MLFDDALIPPHIQQLAHERIEEISDLGRPDIPLRPLEQISLVLLATLLGLTAFVIAWLISNLSVWFC
jgi:hypothetical protein